MQTTIRVSDLFRSAAAAVAPLSELASARRDEPAARARLFRDLRGHLGTLPLAGVAYGLLTAIASDAEDLLTRREFGAASWQLSQLERRLNRLASDWDLAPSPRPARSARP